MSNTHRIPDRFAFLDLGRVVPGLAQDGVVVEPGDGAQEVLGHPILEYQLVDPLEAQDHQAVFGQRRGRVGVDRKEILVQPDDLGAHGGRAVEAAKAILGVGLEEKRAATAASTGRSDGRGHRAAPHTALAGNQNELLVENGSHGWSAKASKRTLDAP